MTALIGRRLVAVLALLVLAPGCSGDTSVPPPAPSATSAGRTAAAQRVLEDLAEALSARDAGAAAALGGPEATDLLRTATANAARLDLEDIAFRVIDDQALLDDADRERYGPRAWAASVQLTYRLPAWDRQATRLETRVVFGSAGDTHEIIGLGGGASRTPLWLTGPLARVASGRVLVIARDDGERFLRLGRRALDAVARVLPDWRGPLVVEVPVDGVELAQTLAAPADRYATIAAVTASVDGSLAPGAPVHVFVNPTVFDTLGPRGAQVVMSHEGTHVATEATFADVPTWLLEGFADYVALAHAGIPVSTAAAQALGRIRKNGLPDGLPTAADLDPTATGLGATYELAWLAARFIAVQHGEAGLVAFYRQVSAGVSVEVAFREALGTTEAEFVRRWRADLKELSTAVTG